MQRKIFGTVYRAWPDCGFYPAALVGLARNHSHRHRELVGSLPQRLVFGGSYSLKSVIPALVPEMTYKGMAVADGQAAGLVWKSLISSDCGEAERKRKQQALLDYCAMETLGMVRIIEALRKQRTQS